MSDWAAVLLGVLLGIGLGLVLGYILLIWYLNRERS